MMTLVLASDWSIGAVKKIGPSNSSTHSYFLVVVLSSVQLVFVCSCHVDVGVLCGGGGMTRRCVLLVFVPLVLCSGCVS